MTYRQRLFVLFAVIILTLSVLEILTDMVEQRRAVQIYVNQSLNSLEYYADVAVRYENGKPLENSAEPIPFDSRIRVFEANTVLLTIDESRPGAMFAIRDKTISPTQRLELAVDTRAIRSLLAQSFWRDVAYDIFNIVLALGLAWWLSSLALRSLENLSQILQKSKNQTFPEAMNVPAGNDVLAKLVMGINHLFERYRFVLDRERVLMRYVAQEISNPLSATASQIESLAMGSASEDMVVPNVQRSLERMQQVLQTLPSLAYIEDSKTHTVSLIQLLKETLQLIPDNDQSRIGLKISMTSNPKVSNPNLVSQCVLSLIDNALQSKGEIKVLLEPFEGSARLRVEDYGAVISDHYLELLKRPLFQLPDQVPDRVLRLAFVRHILTSLEGSLDIRNTGRGLEVLMTLPVAEVSLSSTQINKPKSAQAPVAVKI